MEKKLTVIPPSQTNGNAKSANSSQCRVAAYCRVSTEQEEQMGSFANQIAYYTDYINEKEEYQLAGIFSDEGISGTGTRKRAGFRSMIAACEAGKVDLVITKSISRFARNTRDCLHYARYLKSLGIPVIFEKEGINTMESSGELLFTILSSLAQEESRNISENTRWGIRSRFQQGIPHINAACFLGYDKDEAGHLVINEGQAKVVRRIFREFLEGWQPSEIARMLNTENISGVHGESRWAAVSVVRILQNEKYKGDLLMQKYYIRDFLTKELEKNDGKLTQYYVENDHEAIIEREIWDAAQLEINRIKEFKRNHQIRELGSSSLELFYGKVFSEFRMGIFPPYSKPLCRPRIFQLCCLKIQDITFTLFPHVTMYRNLKIIACIRFHGKLYNRTQRVQAAFLFPDNLRHFFILGHLNFCPSLFLSFIVSDFP